MKVIIILILIFLNSHYVFAQSTIDKMLLEIEKNNLVLAALKKKTEADKLGNRTGIYLSNPEFDFSYLVGNPSILGNRTDISLVQSFDFPTVYFHRKKIAGMNDMQADLAYQKQVKDVLHNARVICADIVYMNALCSEYTRQKLQATELAEIYRKKLEKGDGNQLDYNKAMMNLHTVEDVLEHLEIERTALLSELASMNGGQKVSLTDTVFSLQVLPSDFETWFSEIEKNIPELSILHQETEKSLMQEKLSKAIGLPKFSAGYKSEKVAGEQFQGVSVGITIPLWENKNNVKYSRAKSVALQDLSVSTKTALHDLLKSKFEKILSTQKLLTDCRQALNNYDNTGLLRKALDQGEISFITYLQELSIFNEIKIKLLETENELNTSTIELLRY
ncbi:MAG: hypothetical protein A2275_02895 [Bacteroidetes bacterium RIFOXYA12_FULL_35_11]|nr:MAG: hypothetical protein A2X01_01850 [Bacteroidetes bacterium GWF2_35_48]OFY75727.1 MAG: hypothetical protein A2275_02895 [Bacteroidetes bacterium RIFOXYA12_FULL_35_11]OFY97512.1 MAG: hypothetical protein A2491_00465 [Bacteroidetes bacterium RIFOXYC12_FULL_35_7]OFY97709.1 MAG: hypothetical protein A2309_13665 [Bacteroidetes bacterium RIFOXYB2_FULL_35_7]HBX51524.1 transporter [Bacteroidales bacterium]